MRLVTIGSVVERRPRKNSQIDQKRQEEEGDRGPLRFWLFERGPKRDQDAKGSVTQQQQKASRQDSVESRGVTEQPEAVSAESNKNQRRE